MSFDVLVRALFSDSGVSAGLAKANASIKQLEASTPGGARGLLAVERGLSTLAAEAVGVQGPIGRVAEGLLRFGGGTTLVLGAVAGIGLIAEAYKLSGAEAERLTQTHDKLAASYDKILTRGKAQVQALDEARSAVAAARAEVERLSASQVNPLLAGAVAGGVLPMASGGTASERASAQENLNLALRNLGQLQRDAVRAQDEFVASTKREGEALSAANVIRERAIAVGRTEHETLIAVTRVTAEATAATKGLDAAHTAAFVANQIRIAQQKEENETLLAQRNLLEEIASISGEVNRFLASPQGLSTIQGIGIPSLKDVLLGPDFRKHPSALDEARLDADVFFRRGITKADSLRTKEQIEAVSRDRKGPDFSAISASSLALLGAVNQGGMGGVLSAGGGLLSSLSSAKGLAGLSPWGIGLTALGGVFSLFDNSEERRHKEMMAQLRKIEQAAVAGPTKVQPIIVSSSRADAAAAAYETGRLYDRDAIPRGVGGQP